MPVAVFPFSDQTTSERILRENKHFVEFVNDGITNFAEDKIDSYRKAYELHFNADVAFLQADYRRTYKKIYASQGILASLYSDIVKDVYLEDSKNILDTIAPRVISSKNARARLFLTLGYRDRTISWTHFTVGDASNPKLYSYRIYKYIKAIQYARRAKRYAFLALFESQDTETKRRIYANVMKTENQKGNPFFSRFVDLEEKEYIREMSKEFEDYEREQREKTAAQTKEEGGQASPASFEKNVEKRVRFRNEKRTARFLINTEYDPAEDIMRSYLEDFNFKLINSTFEILSTTGGASPGKEATGSEKGESQRIDYNKYKIHLMDNYSRLAKNSVLESFYGQVAVEDAVDEDTMKAEIPEKEDHSDKESKEPANKETGGAQ
ncbi:MAG: hypothetical protein JXA20_06040 [Spirochaetes bacterium]|nr:hypothetical protein [Spirochaetota bacterium]